MKKCILKFILIILLFSCVHKTNEKMVVLFTSDELDIINKIIMTINHENKVVVVNKNLEVTYTTQDNNRNDIYKYLKRTKNVGNDLLNSFKKNNKKQMKLKKDIVFDFNFIWWDGHYRINNENDPINYYGIITFSKIGFNKEQTKAILYIGIMLEDDGEGNYYILEKENKEWKIVNIIGGWIT
jgi:hypothetical protein